MKLTKIASFFLPVLLFGCTAIESIEQHDVVREEIDKEYESVKNTIDETDPIPLIRKFNRVYVNHLTKEDIKMPDWYSEHKRISPARDIKLVNLLQNIFVGIPVNFQFLQGVDKDIVVSIPELQFTYGETLEYISSLTGYSHTVNGKDITFKKFEVEVFNIRQLPGEESYVVGKKGIRSDKGSSSGAGLDKVSGDFIGGSDEEYAVMEGTIDVLGDVKKGVDTILGCFEPKLDEEGEIEVAEGLSETGEALECNGGSNSQILRSTSSILVRALPSQMRYVREFVDSKNEIYTSQVSIQVSFITVEFNDDNQFNVDFDLVAESMKNDLVVSAGTTAASGILGGLDPRGGVALQVTDGAFQGTGAFVEALKHQGAVTTKTFPRVIATHNRVGVVGNIDRVNYISGRETLTTASVGSQNAIIQAEAETGFLLYCLPNIGKRDAILKLSTSQSTLLDLETKGEDDQLVESPIINDKLFNTTIKVDYGKSLMIAGLSDSLLQTSGSNSGVAPTGMSRSSKEQSAETILVIDVKRL